MYRVPVLNLERRVIKAKVKALPLMEVLVMLIMPYMTGRMYGSTAGCALVEVLRDEVLPRRKSMSVDEM
jgi:hypothetical protein